MKKSLLSLGLLLTVYVADAATYNITTNGFAFQPSSLSTVVGDTVNIVGSSTHPVVEVDQNTWNANGSTPKAGGWGTQTSNFTIVIPNTSTIYYVCGNHVGSFSMKGVINASGSGMIDLNSGFNLNLFPNPAYNKVTIQMDLVKETDVEIRMIDLSGRLAMINSYKETPGTFRAVLDLSLVLPGNYIVEVRAGEAVIRKKISVF